MKTKFLVRFSPLWICFFLIIQNGISQEKKQMDENIYAIWNKITDKQISNNGQWVSYNLTPGHGDKTLVLYHTKTKQEKRFERAEEAHFDYDNAFVAFRIKPPMDSLMEMRRNRIKDADLPKDSIGIYNLSSSNLEKIPMLESFKMPGEKGGIIAIKLANLNEEDEDDKSEKDKPSNLIIKSFTKNQTDTIKQVSKFELSKESNKMLIYAEAKDSTDVGTLLYYDTEKMNSETLMRGNGNFYQMSLDATGEKYAFVVDLDTSDILQRPYELYYGTQGKASKVASQTSSFLAQDWQISKNQNLEFSKDGSFFFFGVNPAPILQDTSLLEEEIVQVEVWSHTDANLFTQQESKLKEEKKRAYTCSFDTQTKKIHQLTDLDMPEVVFNEEKNNTIAIAYDNRPYLQEVSWLGYAYQDVYSVNLKTGTKKLISKKQQGQVNGSPAGHYFYWYSRPDSSWNSYDVKSQQLRKIADSKVAIFYDEQNDRPMLPYPYGISGWTNNDEFMLIYDRYDIWKIDPKGTLAPKRLTKGREQKLVYRYIDLDKENEGIDATNKMLLHVFDEKDKSSGYVWLDSNTQAIKPIEKGPFYFSKKILKAKHSDELIYTKESFQQFPDLILSDIDFQNPIKISEANPQQKDYNWGTVELVNWRSYVDISLEGLLVKPNNFDPQKKYPLIVNFYERSSDELHEHQAPFAHRSTINYSYYTNRGYVIFNPDVVYKNGYPGESCYNSVMSGIDHIESMGFVDKDRIAVQGHSWGGYQIAHLLTKTDRFRCAEAGAPVVNMTSAYGGIRWGSGMSRMFQYEHTQSRIGATLWERPDLYYENSPIFNTDKVTSPVLIMHNDKDHAVPWYQGIEYFVALRRLGKKAWLLNYNDELHWPQKWQNRLDFNIRMQQFFDHYLMDAHMPKWMKRGVPAIEKSILQGLGTANE